MCIKRLNGYYFWKIKKKSRLVYTIKQINILIHLLICLNFSILNNANSIITIMESKLI